LKNYYTKVQKIMYAQQQSDGGNARIAHKTLDFFSQVFYTIF
jgi:hypothetical protein